MNMFLAWTETSKPRMRWWSNWWCLNLLWNATHGLCSHNTGLSWRISWNMHENISQLNKKCLLGVPWLLQQKSKKKNTDGTESKEGNKDTQLQGSNSSCFSFCQDGAVGNGWQSGHQRTRVHHSGVNQEGSREGHARNYFSHAEIRKSEAFYKNPPWFDENNAVQQMNSIQFLKWSSKKKGKMKSLHIPVQEAAHFDI